jgi:hypothetical protein
MACDVRWETYSGEFTRLLSQIKALKEFRTDPRVQKKLQEKGRAKRVAKSLESNLF